MPATIAEPEPTAATVAARNERVVKNLGLVGRVAMAYRDRIRGLDLEDLVQEGVLAMLREDVKYDPSRELRYSTFVTPWIRAAILRGITGQAHTIRVPESARDRERDVVVGLDPELLSDVAVAPEADDPAADLREWLEAAMAALDPRERAVIGRRFPADGSEPMTLKQVAREMGVSTQRVQQIEARALARLRQVVQDTPSDLRSPTAMPTPAVTPHRTPDALDDLASCLHLVGEPTRLRLICSLAEGEMHVAALVAAIESPQPLLSRHLALLRTAGLVEAERRGQRNYFRLTDAGRRVHAAVAELMT